LGEPSIGWVIAPEQVLSLIKLGPKIFEGIGNNLTVIYPLQDVVLLSEAVDRCSE
jgi:hypothetical protein